jgi:hypothetical protein
LGTFLSDLVLGLLSFIVYAVTLDYSFLLTITFLAEIQFEVDNAVSLLEIESARLYRLG